MDYQKITDTLRSVCTELDKVQVTGLDSMRRLVGAHDALASLHNEIIQTMENKGGNE